MSAMASPIGVAPLGMETSMEMESMIFFIDGDFSYHIYIVFGGTAMRTDNGIDSTLLNFSHGGDYLLTAADLNQDGQLDFVETMGGYTELYLSQGTDSFIRIEFHGVGRCDGDVNGDGIRDLVWTTNGISITDTTYLSILYGRLDFDTIPSLRYPIGYDTDGGFAHFRNRRFSDAYWGGDGVYLINYGNVDSPLSEIKSLKLPSGLVNDSWIRMSAADFQGTGSDELRAMAFHGTNLVECFYHGNSDDSLPFYTWESSSFGSGAYSSGQWSHDRYGDRFDSGLLFSGSPIIRTTPDGTLPGVGYFLTGADFNSDGIGDVAVSMRDGYGRNCVQVFFGDTHSLGVAQPTSASPFATPSSSIPTLRPARSICAAPPRAPPRPRWKSST